MQKGETKQGLCDSYFDRSVPSGLCGLLDSGLQPSTTRLHRLHQLGRHVLTSVLK